MIQPGHVEIKYILETIALLHQQLELNVPNWGHDR